MLTGYRCFTEACFLHRQSHCSPFLLGSIHRKSYPMWRRVWSTTVWAAKFPSSYFYLFWDIRKCGLIYSSINCTYSWENIDRLRSFRTFARPEFVYLCLQETNIAIVPRQINSINNIPYTHANFGFILILHSILQPFLSRGLILHISRRHFCAHFWCVRCLLPHPDFIILKYCINTTSVKTVLHTSITCWMSVPKNC
jgi:hypothetical protein